MRKFHTTILFYTHVEYIVNHIDTCSYIPILFSIHPTGMTCYDSTSILIPFSHVNDLHCYIYFCHTEANCSLSKLNVVGFSCMWPIKVQKRLFYIASLRMFCYSIVEKQENSSLLKNTVSNKSYRYWVDALYLN